jgi:hypothetical protein
MALTLEQRTDILDHTSRENTLKLHIITTQNAIYNEFQINRCHAVSELMPKESTLT